MDELPPRALDVLRQARPLDDCRDPLARQRVRERVERVVGAAALSPGAHPVRAGKASVMGGLKTKLVLGTALLAVAGAGVALRRHAPSVGRMDAVAPSAASALEPPAASVANTPPTSPLPPARAAEAPAPAVEPRRSQGAPRDTLEAEVALLRAVDEAIAQHDTRRAERMLHKHRARFPHSVLAIEREGFEVLVRCIERRPDAEGSRKTFFARYPHSVLTPRIERECLSPSEPR